MNEAIITLIEYEEQDGVPVPYTKVYRVEYEGTGSAPYPAGNVLEIAFGNIVNAEQLRA